MAHERGVGARGLRAVVEAVLEGVLFEASEADRGQCFVIDERVVRGEASPVWQADPGGAAVAPPAGEAEVGMVEAGPAPQLFPGRVTGRASWTNRSLSNRHELGPRGRGGGGFEWKEKFLIDDWGSGPRAAGPFYPGTD